jgi:glycosyltransferase involved in cell wall biosynthesis
MLVVPSRYEPGSIVTGEALGCGLPVVLSDQVGPSEVVQGPHMRIHRAGDVDELECAVRSLLDAVEADEPALRNGARANAEREFGAHVVISQLVRIVRSLSGGSIDAATGSGGADERAEAAASPADDDDALVPA